MNKKRIVGASLAGALLFVPFVTRTTTALADSFYTSQTNAERADITNWVANSSTQIKTNIAAQHIDVNSLSGTRYVIQWGDTLSGISQATGISVAKLAYDNHIQNIDLIYAGDVLILNRDGVVPTDWHYEGDGTHVAYTQVTINSYTDNSDHSVHIDNSPVTIKQHAEATQVNNTTEYVSPKDNGSETASAADTTSESSSDDSSTTSATTLSEDDFESAVQSELADKLGLSGDKADQLSVDFTAKDDSDDSSADTASDDSDSSSASSDEDTTSDDSDTSDEDTTSDDSDTSDEDTTSDDSDTSDEDTTSDDSDTSDEDTTSDDSDADTLYSDDQTVTLSSDALTKKNAVKLADKVYDQLDTDSKLSDLDSADEIDVTITQDGSDFDFNVSTNSDDADADSSSDDADSSDEDTDTSDDSSTDDSDSDSDYDDTGDEDTDDSYSDTTSDDTTEEDY
ncbi:LysM peptidoglycan-binding domain-containing protein [Lacticaseibacillus baoqingensis]|uniref:LysM peptidoglycan-binding domain-containing protein n=1 Tax=Lacticaseibacillus baoqingensis TaxID=2486013 RepID=A0ABW4E6A1_9LACO|nr:LysM peptidoglycan-binding domain-containing protein [Lacticaseibacillus baoqingensis]